MEAIKLFLSVKKMAFVIAADEENVASAIGRRLATTGQPITSRLYLEKIVQVPVRIPALGRDQTEEYLALLMLADLERIDDAVAKVKSSRPAKPHQLVQRLGETLPADRHGEVELAEALTPLLHRYTMGNPRRLKRFLNAYWLRMSFASARGVDLQPDALAKLMLAELYMPDLFGQLLAWLAAGVVADKVAEIEAGAGDHSAGVRDWGELPPKLPAGDLAKYLFLAASLRGETIEEAALPPDLRDLATRLASASQGTRNEARREAVKLEAAKQVAVIRYLASSLRQQGVPGCAEGASRVHLGPRRGAGRCGDSRRGTAAPAARHDHGAGPDLAVRAQPAAGVPGADRGLARQPRGTGNGTQGVRRSARAALMGTSGAYGGSPGFKPVRDQTQQWLGAGAAGSGGGGDGTPGPPELPPGPPVSHPPVPGAPPVGPALARIIAALGAALAGGGGGRGGAGLTGGGRNTTRASTAGGRALGGAYGARTGNAATLGELGLDLGELTGLSRYQQARRIVEAAIGPRGDVLDSELRQANASVVLWALTEEVEPTPADLANRWVVEYVWEVWITESGPLLQEHSADGSDRVRLEQEMRAALEATVSVRALPEGRTLTTTDFTTAIDSALGSLRRIAGSAA